MSIEASFNFRRIDERLTTSGLVGIDELERLGDEGYEVVINLMPDADAPADVDERRIVQEQGIDYVYLPVDFAAPTRADLEAFADAMDANAGRKVHVHCAANYRVSAFYSLYAVERELWREDEAEQFVRGVWDPSEFPAWHELVSSERARVRGSSPPDRS